MQTVPLSVKYATNLLVVLAGPLAQPSPSKTDVVSQPEKMLNSPPKTVVPKSQQRASEFRGHSDGKYIQAQRLREVGDARRRAESLRPEDPR